MLDLTLQLIKIVRRPGQETDGDLDLPRRTSHPKNMSDQSAHARHAALEEKHHAGPLTEEEMAEARGLLTEAAIGAGFNLGPVYHGTPHRKFDGFEKSRIASNYNLLYGEGFYFTESRKAAEHYARGSGRILKVYLALENPLIVSSVKAYRDEAMPDIENAMAPVRTYTETLVSKGYDGIVAMKDGVKTEIVAFNPTQIQSAELFTGVSLADRFQKPQQVSLPGRSMSQRISSQTAIFVAK